MDAENDRGRLATRTRDGRSATQRSARSCFTTISPGYLVPLLASALPGFRELRAPLIAGFLWLFASWLLLRDQLPTKPAQVAGVVAVVVEMAEVLPAVALLAAASTVAYLIGTVIEGVVGAMRRTVHAYYLGPHMPVLGRDWKVMADLWPSMYGMRWLSSVAAEQRGRAGPQALDAARQVMPRFQAADSTDLDMALSYCAASELSIVHTRLIGEQADLHSTVDRIRAEGEFRLVVATPLCFLFVVLTCQDSAFWITGLVAVAVLVRQGFERQRAAADLLVDAIYAQRVTAPVFDRFASQAEMLSSSGSAAAESR